MKPIKLLSMWVGPLPPWHGKFAEQMKRFKQVDWELIVPPYAPRAVGLQQRAEQIAWLNRTVSDALGCCCNKGLDNPSGTCDTRPFWGEVFKDRLVGYDYWGWSDMDLLFGDLDGLLPPLMANCEVLSFKYKYLSGCFSVLRNEKDVVGVYHRGEWRKILAEERYHFWEEGPHRHYPDECFFNVVRDSNLRMTLVPDLYTYDTPEVSQPVEFRGEKLFSLATGREVAFLHFMSDQWPMNEDGTCRWRV